MEADRWRRVEELYHDALDLPTGERAAFLARECLGDDQLRVEVESLLSHFDLGTVIERPAVDHLSSQALEAMAAGVLHESITKSPPSLQWYVLIAALVSVIGNLYLAYYYVRGPSTEVFVEDRSGGIYVSQVLRNPAGKGSLTEGDHVLEVNGQRVSTIVDWFAVRMNVPVNKSTDVTVDRAGQRTVTHLRLSGSTWITDSPTGRIRGLIFIASKLLTLGVGLLVVFKRPLDHIARLGGWVLVTMGTIFEPFPWGFASALRPLPVLFTVSVMLVYVSAVFRTPLLFGFLCFFPKKLVTSGRVWAAIAVTPVLSTAYSFYLLAKVIYEPADLTSLAPKWFPVALGVQSLVYLVAGLVVVPINYCRLETEAERRRFRVLCFGVLVGLLFYLAPVLQTVFAMSSTNAMADSDAVEILATVGYPIFPLAFAYAILRHRLFGIQVIIRRGLQYALARSFLLSLLPLTAAAVAIDILAHGQTPLFTFVATRGIYMGVAIFAIVGFLKREDWLVALDRRFFRDKYDAQQLLRKIVEQIRVAHGIEEVSRTIVEQIAQAMHAGFCSMILRKPGSRSYRPVAIAPSDCRTAYLPADSKLIPLLRALGHPLAVEPVRNDWIGGRLPLSDLNFLRDACVDLVVPVALQDGLDEVILLLGVKLSEEPYGREDIALLEDVALAVALLVERAPGSLLRRTFEECPICGNCYESGTGKCSEEGTPLKLVASPRLLANRYQLDKHLGDGGMGVVYRAKDSTLARDVAVKMMKDEFTSDADAIARFQRESRISASLSHPNIVTVYDFGVDVSQRVFLVMEFLEGVTLRDELRMRKRLTPQETLRVFEGICAGVGAAHSMGLVHRDLKPENVFVVRSPEESVKITDFGIAKVLAAVAQEERQTASGVVLGTIRYMSPEQLRGKSVSPLWDIWALTVIAFEVLCGEPPFSATDNYSLQAAIVDAQFQGMSKYLPQASASMEDFFKTGFSPILTDRPSSVIGFWNGLQRALVGC